MATPLEEARREGITAGREWFEAIAKPYLVRFSAGDDAETTAAEMGAELEREIPRRIHAAGQDLLNAGLTREQVKEWAAGVALGAGWRAKEVAAQIGAAND